MENLEVRRAAGVGREITVLYPQGPLTMATLFDFQNAVRQPDIKNAILDLTAVPYIDSAGLGVILSAWAHNQRTGYQFALTGVTDRVRVLLQMTRVDSMLPQFGTVADAERNFAGNASAASS